MLHYLECNWKVTVFLIIDGYFSLTEENSSLS
jgi:hypothetical protein